VTSTNFAERLSAHAATRADQVAVWFPRGKHRDAGWDPLTFGQLESRSHAVARGLLAAGFQPGERAVLLIRPNPDFYPLVFGMFRAGVVPVFIDPGMGASRALGCVQNIAPEGLIAITPAHVVSCLHRAPFRSVQRRVTAGPRLGWSGPTVAGLVAGDATPLAAAPVSPDDDAVIVFTSGATGAPKGVSLTHGVMSARVDLIQQLLGFEPGEVISETLLVYTILEICMGMTVAVPPMDLSKPATVDPASVLTTIRRFQPATASASPVVWQKLARFCIDKGERLDGLKRLLTTAAPIPIDLHQRLTTLTRPGTDLVTPYGATEAMPVAMIGSHEILRDTAALTQNGAGTCVGRLAPQAQVRIIRLTDDPIPTWSDDLEVPTGALGEITVVSPGVSAEYRNAPEGNAKAKIRHGDHVRHRMGDTGYLDAEGRLWFCGRTAHVLHTASGPVPNVPLEGVINQHPAIYRSAAVGVGPRGAEVAVGVYELEPGVPAPSDLHDQLTALVAGTRWAGSITAWKQHPGLPTDPRHNSKIRNEEVKAWVEAQR
jgi:acyl-CoA synthetase (AMP-forming)/AMP-acid ligase II